MIITTYDNSVKTNNSKKFASLLRQSNSFREFKFKLHNLNLNMSSIIQTKHPNLYNNEIDAYNIKENVLMASFSEKGKVKGTSSHIALDAKERIVKNYESEFKSYSKGDITNENLSKKGLFFYQFTNTLQLEDPSVLLNAPFFAKLNNKLPRLDSKPVIALKSTDNPGILSILPSDISVSIPTHFQGIDKLRKTIDKSTTDPLIVSTFDEKNLKSEFIDFSGNMDEIGLGYEEVINAFAYDLTEELKREGSSIISVNTEGILNSVRASPLFTNPLYGFDNNITNDSLINVIYTNTNIL
jgi:hypothetical protein